MSQHNPAIQTTLPHVTLTPPTQDNQRLIQQQLTNDRRDAAARFAYWSLCHLMRNEPNEPDFIYNETERAKQDWLRAATALQAIHTATGEELQGHDLGSSGW